MEAIVGVWLTSLVGATAFSVAGYVLGQRGVSIPFLKLLPQEAQNRSDASSSSSLSSSSAEASDRKTPDMPPGEILVQEKQKQTSSPLSLPPILPTGGLAEPPRKETPSPNAGRYSKTQPLPVNEKDPVPSFATDADDDEDRPTLVPDRLEHAAVLAAAVATIPPPRVASFAPSFSSGRPSPDDGGGALAAELESAKNELEATKNELRATQARSEANAQAARAAEVVRRELEKQIETLRADLKLQVVARATAETSVEELGDRLASASSEASSLRHKVSLLDKQAKQLREALQGRVRALTTSEWHRRRDLEEAEEARVKLRDVYDKIENTTSMPPGADASPSGSTNVMRGPSSSSSSSSSGQQPSFDDAEADHLVTALQREVSRLSTENQTLRTRTSLAPPPKKPSRDSVPELDLGIYEKLVARVRGVAGLRGAVISDEVGSVLVGSGDLAQELAAFGAYIKDAGARTEGLLPLDGVEEVDVRDRHGMLLCAKVVARAPAELSLVLLGNNDASVLEAKKIAVETLRPR